MYKKKLGSKIVITILTLLIMINISSSAFAENLTLGVRPAVISVDMTSKDTTEFELTILQSSEVKETDITLALDYNIDLIQDYEQPTITLDTYKAVVKQNSPLKIKGAVKMPKDRIDMEYEVDIIISTNVEGNVVGSLRVPVLLKNGVISNKSVVFEGTRILSSTGNGMIVLYKDYFNLIKSLFSFNNSKISKSWNIIKYKTYIRENNLDTQVDLGSTETVKLSELVSKSKSDIDVNKYVFIEEEPMYTDFLSSIQVNNDLVVLNVGDKKYNMKFEGVETINFRQEIVKLDEKLDGRISYKDMLDYISLPKTIYSNSLSLNSTITNNGKVSAQPSITYTYKLKPSDENSNSLSSKVLLVKGSSKTVSTSLDLSNVDKSNDLDINLNIENSDDTLIANDKLNITFMSIRYSPIVIFVSILILIFLSYGVFKIIRRKRVNMNIVEDNKNIVEVSNSDKLDV